MFDIGGGKGLESSFFVFDVGKKSNFGVFAVLKGSELVAAALPEVKIEGESWEELKGVGLAKVEVELVLEVDSVPGKKMLGFPKGEFDSVDKEGLAVESSLRFGTGPNGLTKLPTLLSDCFFCLVVFDSEFDCSSSEPLGMKRDSLPAFEDEFSVPE